MKRILKVMLILILILALLFGSLTAYVLWDNKRVVTNHQVLTFQRLPQAFDDEVIAFLTDFHNSSNYKQVIASLQEADPSYIFIVGDLVSMDTADFSNTENLLKGLVEIAPVYYTYGNHEIWSENQETHDISIGDHAERLGVHLLNDQLVTFEKDGERINVVGIRDLPYPDGDYHYTDHMKEKLEQFSTALDPDVFTITLMHRANQIDLLEDFPCDLILSGHTHGGHVNLPVIQEKIIETHLGGETPYIKGRFKLDNGQQAMVSSGVGVEENIPRIFNTPEVVVIRLNLAWADGGP